MKPPTDVTVDDAVALLRSASLTGQIIPVLGAGVSTSIGPLSALQAESLLKPGKLSPKTPLPPPPLQHLAFLITHLNIPLAITFNLDRLFEAALHSHNIRTTVFEVSPRTTLPPATLVVRPGAVSLVRLLLSPLNTTSRDIHDAMVSIGGRYATTRTLFVVLGFASRQIGSFVDALASTCNDFNILWIGRDVDRSLISSPGPRSHHLKILKTSSTFDVLSDIYTQLSLVSYIPTVVIKALLTFGPDADEGRLVDAVAAPWYAILDRVMRDPRFLHDIKWRELEEFIAGAYKLHGCPKVILTPRSGDDGRDVVATWPGIGSIRIIDQVKAYGPHHVVTADEVRSMIGALECDANVSKGIITTTSHFAPGVLVSQKIQQFIPYRLELKDGAALLGWLGEIHRRRV